MLVWLISLWFSWIRYHLIHAVSSQDWAGNSAKALTSKENNVALLMNVSLRITFINLYNPISFWALSKSLNDWSLEKLLPSNVNDELFPSTGWLGKDSVGHYNDSACAWWVCGNVNGTFCGVQKISQWSYSRLCQERRIRCNKTSSLFIVFLHFGLIWLSTVTQYTSLFKGWTLCDIRTERWLLLV